MPLYKRCSLCRQRLPSGTTCECRKKRYFEEDKYYKNDIYKAFYKTGEWLETREIVINKLGGIDIYSFYILGVVEYGTTVHHITEIKEDFSRRLDISNLIYLTDSNHQLIHKEMRKSKADKERMQKLLYDLLQRYIQDNTE